MMQEKRSFDLKKVSVENRADGSEPPTIVGYAAVFDQWSEDLGNFREKIARGAFTEAIRKDDIRALFNHNPDHVLGRNTSGTLRLIEDEHGLRIEIDPPDTQVARDLVTSMRRGDITQMSFGFTVIEQEWSEEEDPEGGTSVRRVIKRAGLYDVSPVTFPAYKGTEVAVRSMDEWRSQKNQNDEGFKQTLEKHAEILNLGLDCIGQ